MKQNTITLIKEMKKMLTENNRRNNILENFILPEEDENQFDNDFEDDEFDDDNDFRALSRDKEMNDVNTSNNHNQEEFAKNENQINGIEKELINIRKIALSVIERLADKPKSSQYEFMKKIWNMVDKALEDGDSSEEVKSK